MGHFYMSYSTYVVSGESSEREHYIMHQTMIPRRRGTRYSTQGCPLQPNSEKSCHQTGESEIFLQVFVGGGQGHHLVLHLLVFRGIIRCVLRLLKYVMSHSTFIVPCSSPSRNSSCMQGLGVLFMNNEQFMSSIRSIKLYSKQCRASISAGTNSNF